MRIACLALIVIVCSSSSATADSNNDELPTVEEVRQHLYQWRKDLVVFRIRYQVTYPMSVYRTVRDFLMTDGHDYVDSYEVFAKDKAPEKTVKGGNGAMRFQARYLSPLNQEKWQLASVGEEARITTKVGSTRIVTPLYVMLDAHSGRWMDDECFSVNDVKIRGREVIDGERCIVLEVQYYEEGKVDGKGSKIWLAEDKDFLIKKITPNAGQPTGRVDGDYLCTEYRKLGRRWYPHKGKILLPPDGASWEVLDFQENPAVTRETFLPPSSKGLIPVRPRRADKSPTSSVNQQGLPDATPSSRTGWFFSTFMLVVGCVGLVVWWRLNNSR